MIYWFIGQPGCGKTTLAKRLKKELNTLGYPAIHLDGDALRKIFDNAYAKENFTKEYRTEQTRALQRFVAHVADQGINMIVSTVNPYRDVREEFKKTRKDICEIIVSTDDIRGRENFHVKDFEMPLFGFTYVSTGGKKSEEDSFNELKFLLKRKKIVITIISNVSFGEVAPRETREFDTNEEMDKWIKDNLVKFGGFPTVIKHEKEII